MKNLDPSVVRNLASSILGTTVELHQLRKVKHDGTGLIYDFYVEHHHYLLKRYTREFTETPADARRFIQLESTNNWNINQAKSFHRPTYYGTHKDAFLTDYIEGTLFQDLLDKGENVTSVYGQAISTLAHIHTALNELQDRRRLRRSYSSVRLEKYIKEAVNRVQTIGIPAFKKRGFSPNELWAPVLNSLPVAEMVDDLSTDKSYFLGHGDYKPNNLIISSQNEIYVIDWLGISKAQPWYDLAYLLVGLPIKEKGYYVQKYLQIMHGKGYLKHLDIKGAEESFRSGMIYQQLIRARSNSKFIAQRTSLHHVQELREALDGLVELMS